MRLKRHQEEQGNVRKKDFRSRTPELQREGKKIMTTPRLILSFFLTTLKNRWTFLPCIFFLFFFNFILLFFRYVASSSVFIDLRYSVYIYNIYIYIFLSVSLRQWYAAPITEEKMSHHGQISYGFIRYCTLGKKCLSFLFFSGFIFWLIVSHVVVCGEHRGWKWGSVGRTRGKKTSRKIVQNAKEHAKGKATKNCSVYRERKKYKDQKASFNVLLS